jgi:SAM-dependent methyltransferase
MSSANNFVEAVRLAELDSALARGDQRRLILEVGAGNGWQARELERRGFSVKAVDVPEGPYTAGRVWPVQDYDGRRLPYDDESFECIFSSNVLEHVPALHELLIEQLRVLKRGGSMIHVVPSSSWRFWTSITYYPHVLRKLLAKVRPRPTSTNDGATSGPPQSKRSLMQMLWSPPHGVETSTWAELRQFSRGAWTRVFSELPVVELKHWPAGVFYSGYEIMGFAVSLSMRQKLSPVLGSSCHVFSMRKP